LGQVVLGDAITSYEKEEQAQPLKEQSSVDVAVVVASAENSPDNNSQEESHRFESL
jgi:hypothetical protein